MQSKTFNILIIVLLLSSFSCKETPPEPGNGGGIDGDMLTVEDVGVTDAILHLRIPGGLRKRNITLLRDTIKILSKTITSLDSIIIDERLLPKRSYRYTLTVENFLNIPTQSYVDITTMDTTSHNFTWEIYILGDGISSNFRDVAIVNDTCIYAVGEIYNSDSTQSYTPFGLAIWNGKVWQLKRLYYNGTNIIAPIRGISVFNPNDVWLAAGSIFHWDGVSTQAQLSFSRLTLPDPNATVEKLWETSNSNLYGVGNVGTLVCYSNSTWEKLESGTELDICDIWGSINIKTGEEEILAVASQHYSNRKRSILKIVGSNVTILPDSGIDDALTGVWFMPGRKYYVTGGSIYKKRFSITNPIWFGDEGGLFPYFKNSIRGNDINDIVIACDRGNILHFDGYTWKSYIQWTHLDYGNYYKVAIKNNLVVAVGENYGRGIIAMGRR